MSLLFFKLVRELGGKPVVLVRKFYVQPATKERWGITPYTKIETVYTVSSSEQTLIVGWISIYSESEVVKGKLLVDRSPVIVFPDAIWGNNQIMPVGLLVQTDISLELVNETAQADTVWVKIIGAEILTDRVEEFFNRLRQYGFPC